VTTYSPERAAAAARGRHGDPVYPSRIDRSGGPEACWPWTGHRRVLAEYLGRPIDEDKEACHSCDNPACCNPAHLFEATHADNIADMNAKGRNVWQRHPERKPRGERVNTAWLSAEQVAEIRTRYRRGDGVQLAAEYGVSKTAISRVVLGRTWTHADELDAARRAALSIPSGAGEDATLRGAPARYVAAPGNAAPVPLPRGAGAPAR